MEYEHAGVKIVFTHESGTFSAVVGGKHQRLTSLAAMKKKIDALNKFESFECIHKDRYSNEYKIIKIVGIKKPSKNAGYFRKNPMWITESGFEISDAPFNTPGNLAAMKEVRETQMRQREELEKFKEQQNKIIEALSAKIIYAEFPKS